MPTHYNIVPTGISHPIVIENITGDINPGDEIAVYANNKLVGATKVIDSNSQYIIPAWQQIDDHGLYLDGYSYGDDIELRLWRQSTNHELIVLHNFNETKFLDQFITHGDISISDIDSSPLEFGLSQAYPNPFNPETNFDLTVPIDAYVSVKIYNVMGQLVDILVDDFMKADIYNLTWNAHRVPSGVYIIQAQNGSSITNQKIMLLK